MNIYIFSDESGVFDKNHEQLFVFGGLLFLDVNSKNIENRKYIHVENVIRHHNKQFQQLELKATRLNNHLKGKLFRSLNHCIKFGVVIELSKINDNIFSHKKTKQRYLDYAFKIGLKRILEELINKKLVDSLKVANINVYCDEHTTATNGKYELRESLEQEFKCGTFNYNFNTFFPPLFPNISCINLKYCNSNKTALIRAADLIANKIYFHSKSNSLHQIANKVFITKLP